MLRLFTSNRQHRVHSAGALGWNQRSDNGDDRDRDRHPGECRRIVGLNLVQECGDEARQSERGGKAADHTSSNHRRRLSCHEAQDVGALRAEREPDAQLARALRLHRGTLARLQ